MSSVAFGVASLKRCNNVRKNIIEMLQLPATSASFLQLVAKRSGFVTENPATFIKDHIRVALP